MPVEILAAIAPVGAAIFARQVISNTVAATIGPKFQQKVRDVCGPVGVQINRWRDKEPLLPSTNHDLSRALARAFVSCGTRWRKDIERSINLEPELARQKDVLKGFCIRIEHYLFELEQQSKQRNKPFESNLDDAFFTKLLDAIPLSQIDQVNLVDLTNAITTNFQNFIYTKEGKDWPDTSVNRLRERFTDEGVFHDCSIFGYHVVEAFLEILKSGKYPEATVAF